jgi:hypothetical protein
LLSTIEEVDGEVEDINAIRVACDQVTDVIEQILTHASRLLDEQRDSRVDHVQLKLGGLLADEPLLAKNYPPFVSELRVQDSGAGARNSKVFDCCHDQNQVV